MTGKASDDTVIGWAREYAQALMDGYLLSGDPGWSAKGVKSLNKRMREVWGVGSSGVKNRTTIIERVPEAKAILDEAKKNRPDPANNDAAVQPIEPPALDQRLRERRLEMEIEAGKKREKEMLNKIIELEDLRGAVLNMADMLDAPVVIRPSEGEKTGGKRTVILHISDVHCGEHVDIFEMDGLNSYNPSICEARVTRLFQKAAALMTTHWTGDPVEEIIICLGGDMIDGNLREESRRGAALPVAESVKLVSEIVAGGMVLLKKEMDQLGVDVPMRVYTAPGNHSRLTPKPHIVEGQKDNLDMIVSWMIEKIIGPVDWVKFYYTDSGEPMFNAYGWWFLLRHGHEGTAGTGGMYGPVYKQVRGMYKAQTSYARRGRPVNWVLQGHDHTPSKIPFGYANSSVVGYNPYAMRKLLADPTPASQNMLVVEKRLGIIDLKELFLGVPEEGTLYKVPEIDEGMIADLETYLNR